MGRDIDDNGEKTNLWKLHKFAHKSFTKIAGQSNRVSIDCRSAAKREIAVGKCRMYLMK